MNVAVLIEIVCASVVFVAYWCEVFAQFTVYYL